MARRWGKALLLLGLGLMVGTSRADGPLAHIGIPGESGTTARRLAGIDQLTVAAKWSEVVEEYLRLLEEAGDDLVPLNPQHSLQARWLCHRRLAALPPTALALYRERVDGAVKKWWEQAEPAHDVALFRRIVSEAFCSRWADRALDFLGDLAFERGDFEEAGYWWGLLAPPLPRPGNPKPVLDSATSLDLVFPDPQVDVARVRAKIILARLARGDSGGIGEALRAFQTAHGKAEGTFAGQQGNYWQTLQRFAAHPELLESPRQDPPWTTFAGSPSRQWLLPQAPRGYLAELPAVRLDLTVFGKRGKAGPGRVLTPSAAARRLAYYPVIAGGQVVVADMIRVTGYDVRTGKLAGSYNLLEDLRKDGQEVSLEPPTEPGFRYTLSVAGESLFVRLGNQAVVGTREREGSWGDSFLVCLDLRPGRDGKYHRRWRVRASEREDRATIFEGAPVVKDGRLYVARARITGTQVTTAIECSSAATGSRHWHQDVCETRELTDGDLRFHHHLLTLAGPHVAYCSHSGAVVALDAHTGRRAWAVRYPRRGTRTSQGSPSPRDLAPCLYAGGRLFVAPADADRIFCLDAATGLTLWHSQPVEVVQLLGVAGDKLIFTTGLPPRGIQAVGVATGETLSAWLTPAGDVPTFGRGFLAGGRVFWPTFLHGLCLLSQEDGHLDPDSYYFGKRFGTEPLGNLAFGEGCLAIASAEELRIYVPPRRVPDQKRSEFPALNGRPFAPR